MIRIRAAVVGLWLIALASRFAPANAADVHPGPDPIQATTPFVYDEARIYLPVASVAGPLGLFILDTGAQGGVIDSSEAARAGVRIIGEARLRGAGRGGLDVEEGGPLTLLVGQTPLLLDSVHVGALDARLAPYGGRHIGGLIGAEFFHDHVVTVDFARRVLELRDPRHFVYRGAGERLPFRFGEGAPIVDGAITLADGSRAPLRLLVDLGAEADLLVAEPFVAAHPGLARLAPQVVEPLGAGVGGETRFAFARLPKLEVGPVTARDLVVGLSVSGSLRGGYYDALLGARFLQNYRVTFDYARREIILEPNPLSEPDRFDHSGASVTQDLKGEHHFTIHAVAAGSPAAEAGLAPGDLVLSLADRPAGAWSLNQIRRTLSAEDEAAVPITVERAGRRIETIIRLRALL